MPVSRGPSQSGGNLGAVERVDQTFLYKSRMFLKILKIIILKLIYIKSRM